MLPQIENKFTSTTQIVELPSKTYKLNLNINDTVFKDGVKFEATEVDKIIGFVDNLEAIRQAVYHILMTERYAYLIYDENYGIELEQYIGQDLEYINNTIESTLQEALMHDLRITNVTVDNINQIASDIVEVKFTVESIYGNLQMEVNINV